MMRAPRATLASAASTPKVWSEYPMVQPSRSRRSGMAARLTCSGGAGYAETQCRKATSAGGLRAKTKSRARSTSVSDDMPVDTIMGFGERPTQSRSAQKSLSPEAILNASTSGSRNFALSRSSGVDTNRTPSSRASPSSALNSSNESSKRRSRSNRAGSAPLVNHLVRNVWNLTASTPHAAAARTSFSAFPKLPSWLLPISATTRTFCDGSWAPILISHVRNVLVQHVFACGEGKSELLIKAHAGDIRDLGADRERSTRAAVVLEEGIDERLADAPPAKGGAHADQVDDRRALTTTVADQGGKEAGWPSVDIGNEEPIASLAHDVIAHPLALDTMGDRVVDQRIEVEAGILETSARNFEHRVSAARRALAHVDEWPPRRRGRLHRERHVDVDDAESGAREHPYSGDTVGRYLGK